MPPNCRALLEIWTSLDTVSCCKRPNYTRRSQINHQKRRETYRTLHNFAIYASMAGLSSIYNMLCVLYYLTLDPNWNYTTCNCGMIIGNTALRIWMQMKLQCHWCIHLYSSWVNLIKRSKTITTSKYESTLSIAPPYPPPPSSPLPFPSVLFISHTALKLPS